MVELRQPGFEFEEEEEPEIDWDNMTDEQFQEHLKSFAKELPPEEKRYKELIPDYVNQYLGSYVDFDGQRAGVFGFKALGIFNYLEFGFEVDMDNLQKLNENRGVVEFSTGNFPYGGMERFLITLKAFGLIPTECFNGFVVYQFDWTSEFMHEAIELPEKTVAHLKKRKY